MGLGVVIGAFHVVAIFASNRYALKSERKAFPIVVAAMGARIILVLALLAAVVWLLPVNVNALLGGFFAMFVVGSVLEIWLIHKKGMAKSSKP